MAFIGWLSAPRRANPQAIARGASPGPGQAGDAVGRDRALASSRRVPAASARAINRPRCQPLLPVRRAGFLGGLTFGCGGVGRPGTCRVDGVLRLDKGILGLIMGSLLLAASDLLARDVQGLLSAIKRIAGEHHRVGFVAPSE